MDLNTTGVKTPSQKEEKKLALPKMNLDEALPGQLHMSITECSMPDPVLRQRAAGAYQLPRKLAMDSSFTCSRYGS